MSYLAQMADGIQDEALKERLKKILDVYIPELENLPASMHHHVTKGGAYEFACKVVRTSVALFDSMRSCCNGQFNLNRDEVLFMSLVSCLDIPFLYEKGNVVANGSHGEPIFDFRDKQDWGMDPVFFITGVLAKQGLYLSPEQLFTLTFREGTSSVHRTNRSAQDLSPLATLLHTSFLLSMNFPQSTPVESVAPPESKRSVL